MLIVVNAAECRIFIVMVSVVRPNVVLLQCLVPFGRGNADFFVQILLMHAKIIFFLLSG